MTEFLEQFVNALTRILGLAPVSRPTVTSTREMPSGLSWFQWSFSSSPKAQFWLGISKELQDQLSESAAQALAEATHALQPEISCICGGDSAPTDQRFWSITITVGDQTQTILLAFSEAALEVLNPSPGPLRMDLLGDVQLPVSISFGQSHLPLKDVIKLTTGSIIELNRTISEPVEVLVNNCVIARGEVVVVEGNFGVRIQHVVSRRDRLRSVED